jgi:iron(III) transport system substrate-binding protein
MRTQPGGRGPAPLTLRGFAAVAAVLLVLAGCGSSDTSQPSAGGAGARKAPHGEITLYTSYSQPEVDGLVAAYRTAVPKVTVKVFRAPTGELSARIAAEQRSGGVRGDVLLLSDPLSMQQYAGQHMLLRWTPKEQDAVPAEARSSTFWGVTTSDVVVVHQPGVDVTSWHDLTKPAFTDAVALPDPSFAGSAFGALGYFALDPGFGLDYYRALRDNGAVQVAAPGDVVTGVAEGRYKAGMALDFVARAAVTSGSPLEISAPAPGAIRLYAPMAVFTGTDNPAAAESFGNFLLTLPAQKVLAALDRHPIRADVPATAPEVTEVVPDWPKVFGQQADLRSGYAAIFDG